MVNILERHRVVQGEREFRQGQSGHQKTHQDIMDPGAARVRVVRGLSGMLIPGF